MLEEYDEEIRAISLSLRTPAVIRLKKGGATIKHVVRFSRINVYTRDGFRYQYCSEKKSMRDLNYDHVIPRARGGRTIWENIVTSCYACNDRKGGRNPEEAGMRARRPRSGRRRYVAEKMARVTAMSRAVQELGLERRSGARRPARRPVTT